MANLDSFSFICQGYECDNEKDAWDSFKKEAKREFKWITGIKYWRRAPELSTDVSDKLDIVYIVQARVFAVEDYIKGLKEAVIDGPYPQSDDAFIGSPELTAYGFAPIGKSTNG